MKTPLHGSSFSLDVSGIAGFFGGEESFAAMSSVHLVRGRRWLGWYNSPGSYFVAKKYGVLARSRVWDGLYPGVNVDPTTMLELDGKTGPRYVAAHSGTRLPSTGHLGYLFANHCKDLPVDQIMDTSAPSQMLLTIVQLEDFHEFNGYPTLPADYFSPFDPLAIIPVAFSIAASVLSAVYGDWYCFAMILLGILSNGISCFVIGSGILTFKHPNPSSYSPPGDGLLLDSGPHVILVKGSEKIVSSITRGKYYLKYPSASRYNDIGFSSVALTMQFLLQLFLVPQGQLFGQIMFLSSLGVSWLFNAYLASVDTEVLQTRILMNVLLHKPVIRTLQFSKWTALTVFAIVYLNSKDAKGFLNEVIPNDTQVWRVVKETIIEGIQTNVDPKKLLSDHPKKKDGLDENEIGLLQDMIDQASIGYLAAKDFDNQSVRPSMQKT